MKSFYACDNPNHTGATNTWFTPQSIIKPFGAFDLDPCTQSFRPFDTAKKHICEDLGECGLKTDWHGRVWLNPPYGKGIADWLLKLARHGNGIALVFARTDTAWCQKAIAHADGVNFLKGRISFISSAGKESSNAATGSMLLAFGRENCESIKALDGVFFSSPIVAKRKLF